MATAAQVIDLGEVRRERAARSATACAPAPVMPPVGFAWVPVWFMLPLWMGMGGATLVR